MTITIREPGSALTHLAACIASLIAAIPLLIKASDNSLTALCAMTVFISSMILLYGASTTYHSVNVREQTLRIFKKLDHAMIFVLIAGSYTPVCLLILPIEKGYLLLAGIWTIAVVGIIIKMFWIYCPKWFSSILYIAMGWVCLTVLTDLVNTLSRVSFAWLLAGGIIYTIGGVIYALKLPLFNARHKYFGSHEIFHCFVMGGSICHFIFCLTIL